MTWARGEEAVRKLLSDGELEHVSPSSDLAERHIESAAKHIQSAESVVGTDLEGAFQLAYDGVRKASAGLLVAQGLRATRRGGHIAVQDTVREQFNGPNGRRVFREISRLRRQRNETEYPKMDAPTVTDDDVIHAIAVATEIVEASTKILDSGRLTDFV